VAVLIPCYNEALTIGRVVREFRDALPDSRVFVYDNASSDETAQRAAEAGATVRHSPRRGKGNVVRHMLREIDAEIYLVVDGDDTYPAAMAGSMVDLLQRSGADMVVGTRLERHHRSAFPTWHAFGNRLISGLISLLFAAQVSDVLSGYRAFTRELVRRIYLRSQGFDIETELTLQTLVRGQVIRETPIQYGTRPSGSTSKLSTWSDGWRIIRLMLLIFRDYKPLVFFSALSLLCFVLGLGFGWQPVVDYLQTRFVSHVPLALLAAALEILAGLFLGIGLILDAITRFHVESQERMQEILARIPSAERQA
jgi:glycosyltransferase involved in cell wall biosynthesis